jgi:hypothetical protein
LEASNDAAAEVVEPDLDDAEPGSGATTPPGGRSPISVPLRPVPNALGMGTPPAVNGLMTTEAAVSAAAELNRQARQREAARVRNARRR